MSLNIYTHNYLEEQISLLTTKIILEVKNFIKYYLKKWLCLYFYIIHVTSFEEIILVHNFI